MENPSGPDLLHTTVYADDLPGLQMAALDAARETYGPTAVLEIYDIDVLHTSTNENGRLRTEIWVRCVNFAGPAAAPVTGLDDVALKEFIEQSRGRRRDGGDPPPVLP